jgi:four helix bundle protein
MEGLSLSKDEYFIVMKEQSGVRDNAILKKSFAFAIRSVRLNQFLTERKEFVLAKQVMRSGTAIGALVREAQYGESRKDFIHKLAIAIKEANETLYWIDLLFHTSWIDALGHQSMRRDCIELLRMLTAIINTTKGNVKLPSA